MQMYTVYMRENDAHRGSSMASLCVDTYGRGVHLDLDLFAVI